MFERVVRFTSEDFDPILEAQGIDPESLDAHEWSKFVDAFCEGTHWYEVAEAACDVVKEIRERGGRLS